MTSEIRGEEELNSGLDILGRKSLLLVISDQLGSLESDSLKHVSDQRVEDVHSFSGDSNVVGNALQDLENVQGKALEVLLSALLRCGFSSHSITFLQDTVFIAPLIYLQFYWLIGKPKVFLITRQSLRVSPEFLFQFARFLLLVIFSAKVSTPSILQKKKI